MSNSHYAADVQYILSLRTHSGADFWTSPQLHLAKGSPFSTLECAMYLLELGIMPSDPALIMTGETILKTWQKDGRFKLNPQSAIYPCHTISALNTLCHLGYTHDVRILTTIQYLLTTQYQAGGWRCNKFSFGRGPETLYANPLPTLNALNAFRFTPHLNTNAKLDKAVDFLLMHWTLKVPLGPCHYGIGSLFMQVEYPFRSYNLFYYVYVLSFYTKAKHDFRFLEAFEALKSKCVDGQIVVERVVPKLAKLTFCQKGKPSALATLKYQEILDNLARE